MTKGKCVSDDIKINEVDRGNGVKEIIYIREAKKPIEFDPIEIKPQKRRIIKFNVRRKRKSKLHEMLIIGIPSALYVGGMLWIRELLTWKDGILYKPYWIITIALSAIILYANTTKKKHPRLG